MVPPLFENSHLGFGGFRNLVFFVGTPVICMGVKSESSGRNEAPESRDPVLGEMCREDFCDSVVLWGLANTCIGTTQLSLKFHARPGSRS